MWRNWQTRRSQKPVMVTSWRFKSSHPHHDRVGGGVTFRRPPTPPYVRFRIRRFMKHRERQGDSLNEYGPAPSTLTRHLWNRDTRVAVTFDAPKPSSRQFRRLPSGWVSSFSALL